MRAPSVPEVSAAQVRAFRLDRHHLRVRAPARAMPQVLRDIGGAQAQLLPAAFLSLRARVRGLTESGLEGAVWKRRRLAKAWCMRRTLFLLPSADVATFVRGSARRAEKEVTWALNFGVPRPTLERLMAATLDALDAPITRAELAERVGRAMGLPLRKGSGGGWGNRRSIPCVQVGRLTCPAYYLLHLAGARGVLCSGPIRDGEATFVRADAWLPRWRDVRPAEAEAALLRLHLRAYGPANLDDFVAWCRLRVTDAREVWSSLEEELAEVSVEGDRAWVLGRDLPALERASLDPGPLRLLPHFDTFLLGHADRAHLLPAERGRHVYRDQGWVAPTILRDGAVVGTWELRPVGRGARVLLRPFSPMGREERAAAREEAEDIGRFLGRAPVTVAIE